MPSGSSPSAGSSSSSSFALLHTARVANEKCLWPLLKDDQFCSSRNPRRLNSETARPRSNSESAPAFKSSIAERLAQRGGLHPSSTTATLVMGDALAVALLNARGFTADDFALSHPGGSLGKRLLLRLADIMHQGERLPVVAKQALIKDALVEMSLKGLGMTAVTDEAGQLLGVFTDGDLRRILDARIDIHQDNIASVMTKSPTTAHAGMLAAEALKIMEDKKINGLIITDDNNKPIGAMNMHDLLKSGVL